jgi:hypothetical protein
MTRQKVAPAKWSLPQGYPRARLRQRLQISKITGGGHVGPNGHDAGRSRRIGVAKIQRRKFATPRTISARSVSFAIEIEIVKGFAGRAKRIASSPIFRIVKSPFPRIGLPAGATLRDSQLRLFLRPSP